MRTYQVLQPKVRSAVRPSIFSCAYVRAAETASFLVFWVTVARKCKYSCISRADRAVVVVGRSPAAVLRWKEACQRDITAAAVSVWVEIEFFYINDQLDGTRKAKGPRKSLE